MNSTELSMICVAYVYVKYFSIAANFWNGLLVLQQAIKTMEDLLHSYKQFLPTKKEFKTQISVNHCIKCQSLHSVRDFFSSSNWVLFFFPSTTTCEPLYFSCLWPKNLVCLSLSSLPWSLWFSILFKVDSRPLILLFIESIIFVNFFSLMSGPFSWEITGQVKRKAVRAHFKPKLITRLQRKWREWYLRIVCAGCCLGHLSNIQFILRCFHP